MKKLLIISLIGISLMLNSCSNETKQTNTSNTDVKIEKNFVEASGTVKPKSIKNIMMDFPASVEKVHVKDGQKVKKDDVLISLKMEDLNVQIGSKEQEIKVAQIGVLNLEDKIKKMGASNPDVKKLQNDLQYAEDKYTKAIEDYASMETLFSSGSISRQELDERKNSLDSKKKDVEDIRYSIDVLQNNRQEENKGLNLQKEKVVSLENDLKALKDKLGRSFIKDTSIISEVQNGVVHEIGYKAGDMISSSKKVLSIMDLDSIYVEANVAEEFIKDVKIGSAVTILPLADNSKKYTGKVERIADMAIRENGQTFVPVDIVIDNKDEFLRPNFNVDVEIMR